MQESIAEAEAKSFAGIPNELVEQEKNLKSTVAFLVQKLSQKPAAEEEKNLRESLFSINHEYNEFIKKLEADYPNYFNLKYNQSSPTIQDLQKLLDGKTAILSYFIADRGKRIYQFIITQRHFKINNLTLPDNFEKYTKGLSNSLLFSDRKVYQESASALSAAHEAGIVEEETRRHQTNDRACHAGPQWQRPSRHTNSIARQLAGAR